MIRAIALFVILAISTWILFCGNDIDNDATKSASCCNSYGEFTADGSCFGHGKNCCQGDPDRDPICGSER